MYGHFQLVPLLITNCSVPDFKIDYNLDYIPTPCAHAIDERPRGVCDWPFNYVANYCFRSSTRRWGRFK